MNVRKTRATTRGPLAVMWALLSSTRTTLVLAIVGCGLAVARAVVPQAETALEIVERVPTEALRSFYAWGLTELSSPSSAWVWAFLALLLGNLLAVAVRFAMELAPREDLDPLRSPAHAPNATEITAARPEVATEAVRGALVAKLGAPRLEASAGSRVGMIFDSGLRFARHAYLVLAIGIVTLGLSTLLGAPSETERSLARVIVAVRQPETGFTGRFDMVAGESFTFFQSPEEYRVVDYSPNLDGLGRAVRFERVFGRGAKTSPSQFWVYEQAPSGFDGRHRKGTHAIDAIAIEKVARPGTGFGSSGAAVLAAIGLALALIGAIAARHPRGRLWVRIDGDAVSLAGIPARAGDARFRRAFDRWARATERAAHVP